MKKIFKAIAAIGMSAGVCLSFAACGEKSTADKTLTEEGSSYSTVEEGSPYSIITKLDLNISFDNNTVYGKVKNTFTLFPATARVYVYLYYSESYTTDYTQMQEVAQNYIGDLDMKKTLTARYEMQGESGYFLARMRYKIDSRDWEERTTDAYKRDYSGIYMQPIADDGSLPVFEDIQPAYESHTLEREKIFENFYVEFDATSTYSKFANDYLKKFNKPLDKEFFIFSLKTNEYYDTLMPNNSWCTLYKFNDKDYFEYNVNLYIEKFGFANTPEIDITGLGRCNLSCTFISAKIENSLNGKLRIEFRNNENVNYIGETENGFINIYIGETCIGTCYYSSSAKEKIPYAFFYNLFVDNLTSNLNIK